MVGVVTRIGTETAWELTDCPPFNPQPCFVSNNRVIVPIICEYISLFKFRQDDDYELEESRDSAFEFYETDKESEYGSQEDEI